MSHLRALSVIALTTFAAASCGTPPVTDGPGASAPTQESPAPAAEPAEPPAADAAAPPGERPPVLPASAELRAILGEEPTDAELVEALSFFQRVPPSGEATKTRGGPKGRDPDPEISRDRDTVPRPAPAPDNAVIQRLLELGLDPEVATSLIVSKIVEPFYQPRVVNGRVDNRSDPVEIKEIIADDPSRRRELEAELKASASVGLLIYADATSEGRLRFPRAKSLRERRNLCSGQRFADEPSVEGCSAVLVTPRRVATAMHCVINARLESMWIVFDHQVGRLTPPQSLVPEDRAYRAIALGPHNSNQDWALIELDRPVVGREPVPIRRRETAAYVAPGEYVFAAGHPDGIPLKIVGSGKVLRHSGVNFITDLDLFKGNSGSPVFDRAISSRREMVGLVVEGRPDYKSADDSDCQVVAQCLPGQCTPNELVLRADVFADKLTAPR